MASLALLVTLMLLFVILLGPATWLLSKSIYIPRFIILLFSLKLEEVIIFLKSSLELFSR